MGFNADEMRRLLDKVEKIDGFKYYGYVPGGKMPVESRNMKNQPVKEVLSFLTSNFSETSQLFVEIRQTAFKSGKWEIILRGKNLSGEILKLAVVNFQKTTAKEHQKEDT